ncbi:hypothetical protein QR680_006959 [Steinernema hermaphroditum]|uniref:C2H2-type domain-containing protein n=1 Tax=Steinernema hermaphroditum TaxID=289476 RepID=A0AA39HZM4_9BILA|nr:hypothetical protein QR680_006959 [Steinernema hermaphroditum]
MDAAALEAALQSISQRMLEIHRNADEMNRLQKDNQELKERCDQLEEMNKELLNEVFSLRVKNKSLERQIENSYGEVPRKIPRIEYTQSGRVDILSNSMDADNLFADVPVLRTIYDGQNSFDPQPSTSGLYSNSNSDTPSTMQEGEHEAPMETPNEPVTISKEHQENATLIQPKVEPADDYVTVDLNKSLNATEQAENLPEPAAEQVEKERELEVVIKQSPRSPQKVKKSAASSQFYGTLSGFLEESYQEESDDEEEMDVGQNNTTTNTTSSQSPASSTGQSQAQHGPAIAIRLAIGNQLVPHVYPAAVLLDIDITMERLLNELLGDDGTHEGVLKTLRFLASYGLLLNSLNCEKCTRTMAFQVDSCRSDKFLLRCNTCKKNGLSARKSVRENSVFQRSKLTLAEIMKMICYWAYNPTLRLHSACKDLHLSRKTFMDFVIYIREICRAWYDLTLNTSNGTELLSTLTAGLSPSTCVVCKERITHQPCKIREHIAMHEEYSMKCSFTDCDTVCTLKDIFVHYQKIHKKKVSKFSDEERTNHKRLMEQAKIDLHLLLPKYFPMFKEKEPSRTRENCKECNASITKNFQGMSGHVMSHMNLKADCPICQIKLNSLGLDMHVKKAHGRLSKEDKLKVEQEKQRLKGIYEQHKAEYFDP